MNHVAVESYGYQYNDKSTKSHVTKLSSMVRSHVIFAQENEASTNNSQPVSCRFSVVPASSQHEWSGDRAVLDQEVEVA